LVDAGVAQPLAQDGAGDAQLVHRVRSGELDAFGELVRRYERRLVRTLVRFLHDMEWARDVAQETFLRIYQRLGEFDTSRRFGPWLFRIGLNLAVDQLRRRRRWRLRFAAPGGNRAEPHVADGQAARELAEEVHFVLQQIPLKYRTVLMLRDLEGFTCSEIAAILNRREATVRWRLCIARDQFRRLWSARQRPGGATAS
jgi:RNA polymerase sigma-70 factor (ECF subfamily)